MKKWQYLKQWHSTDLIEEAWESIFVKHFKPNSYEIRNEISWLTLNILHSRKNFNVPNLREASISSGYIKMDWIKELEDSNKECTFNHLIDCAVELHWLIESDRPHMRINITESEYIEYLRKYTRERIDVTNWEFHMNPDMIYWIENNIQELRYWKFSIVHRDLRHRHLLLSLENKPTLIDWEFSNISEPAQDLAKLVFDWVVNHWLDFNTFFNKVIDRYAYQRKISSDLLRSRVLVFLPIIPLEHTHSFILRKPEWYELEVEKDLWFIKQVFNEEK